MKVGELQQMLRSIDHLTVPQEAVLLVVHGLMCPHRQHPLINLWNVPIVERVIAELENVRVFQDSLVMLVSEINAPMIAQDMGFV